MTDDQLSKLKSMSWKEFGLKFGRMATDKQISKSQYEYLKAEKEKYTPYITSELPRPITLPEQECLPYKN